MKQAQLSWRDGQPLSTRFDDVYFSRDGGLAETEHVFLHNNGLPQRWKQRSSFVIAETGFGSGLNFLATVHQWLQHSSTDACLYYYSVEKYPLAVDDLQQALAAFPELGDALSELLAVYPPAIDGLHARWMFNRRVCLLLLYDDVSDALGRLDIQVDAWYLDGFAPARNPAMWSDDVFDQVARLSHEAATFSTYTAAGFVRRGLSARGFDVEKVAGAGRKRQMLRGRMTRPTDTRWQQPWFDVPSVDNTDSADREVVIIGAGIAGVTSAWALARRGWRVRLIDQQHEVATRASGNPLGVVLPRLSREHSAAAAFDNAAFAFSVYQLGRLQQRYPQLGWQQTGVLQLPSSKRIMQHMAEGNFSEALAVNIDAQQGRKHCGLDIDSDAMLYPLAGYLGPRRLCQILCEDAGDALQLMPSSAVTELKWRDHRWLLSDQQGRPLLSSARVIIANAIGVIALEQTRHLPVSPVRGQISYVPASVDSEKLQCPVCYEGYVLPAEQGRHVIGASFKPGQANSRVLDAEHVENINALRHSLPGVFDSAVVDGGRAAVRAVTPDRLPVVGPVADTACFIDRYGDLHRG